MNITKDPYITEQVCVNNYLHSYKHYYYIMHLRMDLVEVHKYHECYKGAGHDKTSRSVNKQNVINTKGAAKIFSVR